MALAANTIITQSSTAAYAPVAKTRDNSSADQTSSFDDALAQQDTNVAGNSAQAQGPAQGTDKAKTAKSTQIGNKFAKVSDDQAAADAIATAETSQGTQGAQATQSTKVRAGKPGDKTKDSDTDSKSASDAVNDNEPSNVGGPTQQVPLVPPPVTPTTPQPSTATTASSLEAIGEATNATNSAAPAAQDTNNTQASQSTDEAPEADEAQAAEGASASGKALSSNAFQKMLGATKAAAAKDSQAAKAAPDKDVKATDANVGSINTSTDVASNVKSATPANAGMTTTAPATAQADKTTAGSSVTAAATTQSSAAPNLSSLAVEITAKAQSGAKQFNIRLDPPELGRVEVRLSIDATGKAQAHLSADQPQTLELLQKDAPALTQALRDAGLDVSQSGLNFSLRNQQQNSGGNNNASQSNYDGTTTSSTNAVIETSSSGSTYTSGAGLLDIKI